MEISYNMSVQVSNKSLRWFISSYFKPRFEILDEHISFWRFAHKFVTLFPNGKINEFKCTQEQANPHQIRKQILRLFEFKYTLRQMWIIFISCKSFLCCLCVTFEQQCLQSTFSTNKIVWSAGLWPNRYDLLYAAINSFECNFIVLSGEILKIYFQHICN